MRELEPPAALGQAWKAWSVVASGIGAGDLPDVGWRNLGRWARKRGDAARWAVQHLRRYLDEGPVQDAPLTILTEYRRLLEHDPNMRAAVLWLAVSQEVPPLGEPWEAEVLQAVTSRKPIENGMGLRPAEGKGEAPKK